MSFRLERIEVETFGCIRRAQVDFDRGLNVLHGPNDLGKSTLAAAIRASLLLPCNSTAAKTFRPWDDGAQHPRVCLEFAAGGVRRRLEKTWASSTRAQASRLYVWEPEGWHLVEQGRGVDATLRSLLGWGIPEPGGRGGPTGLPASFLATALLGAQPNPSAIFREALSGDPDPSGRERLIAALGVMAQDPLVEGLVREVAAKVDLAFTAKRHRRSGRDAIWTQLDEEVERLARAWQELDEQVRQSDEVVRRLHEASARVLNRRQHVHAVQERLEALRRAHARHQRFEALASARAESLRRLDQIEQLRRERRDRAADIERCEARLPEAEQVYREAEKHLHACESETAAAREASSTLEVSLQGELESGRRELEMRQRLIADDDRRLRGEVERAEQAKAAVQQREDAHAALARARAELATLDAAFTQLERGLEADKRRLAASEQALDHARLREDASRCRRELDRIAQAREWRAQAAALRNEAAATEAKLRLVPKLERRALETLVACDDDLRLARAQLGGTVSIALQPVTVADGLGLEVARDGGRWERVDAPTHVEVGQSLELRIAGQSFATIYAGEAQVRTRVAELERRHAAEVLPLLRHFEQPDVRSLCERYDEELAERSRADALRRQAGALDERAGTVTADKSALERRLARLTEQLGVLDGVADPGEIASDVLEARHRQLRAELAEREERRERAAQRRRQQESEVARLQERCAYEDAAARRFEPPETLDASLAAARAGLAALEGERARAQEALRAFEAKAKQRRAQAHERTSTAQSRLHEAAERKRRAQRELEQLRSERDRSRAALEVLERQLADVDEVPVRERLSAVEAELRELAEPGLRVGAEDVAALERELEQARQDLDAATTTLRQQEGALAHTGGDVVRERAEMLKEALTAAQAHRAEVELEYEAWRLLEQTFEQAQQEQEHHLGRALGRQVAERFTALTAGRYADVQLTTELEMAGVLAAGDWRDPSAFSEGLKEQLATLLRLSIAEQLDSTLVLDDHLTQTDGLRVAWFRELLAEVAPRLQVVVLTCRPEDYLAGPSGGGHVLDLRERIER